MQRGAPLQLPGPLIVAVVAAEAGGRGGGGGEGAVGRGGAGGAEACVLGCVCVINGVEGVRWVGLGPCTLHDDTRVRTYLAGRGGLPGEHRLWRRRRQQRGPFPRVAISAVAPAAAATGVGHV